MRERQCVIYVSVLVSVHILNSKNIKIQSYTTIQKELYQLKYHLFFGHFNVLIAFLICRFFRSTSYRSFMWLVFGHMGNKRYPLPACAYDKIRRQFQPADNDDFVGFVEEEIS